MASINNIIQLYMYSYTGNTEKQTDSDTHQNTDPNLHYGFLELVAITKMQSKNTTELVIYSSLTLICSPQETKLNKL